MAGKDALIDFKKMWTWLCAYPAHDREYYIKNKIKGSVSWINYCPLCNQTEAKDCNGCEILWDSDRGTLCTDYRGPIYKWNNSAIDSHDRPFYASEAAVLAMKYLQTNYSQAR